MNEDELRADLDALQQLNEDLSAELSDYRALLDRAECAVQDWEEKWLDCTQELLELKIHLEKLRLTWHREWEEEFGGI